VENSFEIIESPNHRSDSTSSHNEGALFFTLDIMDVFIYYSAEDERRGLLARMQVKGAEDG
jgi:hypothetical protein